ncbi:uncharacterized protein N7469_010136 [Penicillium citrinum]|uniref:Uncharacterized protein n=1 Tax=Penicillium citrinum TaxID=5077 RepID=A0A9W9NJQ0_PENCI|nr:uncharacterized protein N7469_010136 [Penicillium citrinum]KAJ5221249.1 hypothetical protein N7469_010136 [Penicillium citrinum]
MPTTKRKPYWTLFKSTDSDVLSECNAPTSYGMATWALAGAINLWSDIAAHYSPYPSVIAGPYDRVYTRDMVTNSAAIDYFWWRLYGYGTGPQPNKLESDLLFDVSQGASLALVMDADSGLYRGIKQTRNATTWISATLIIGTQQVNKTVNCREQYVPAIVPWAGDKNHKPHPYMSFFLLYPTASTINAVVAPSYLEVSYPNTTQTGTDIFTFALAQLPPSWTLIKKKVVKGLEELPSLNVTVNEKGLQRLPVVYGATVKDNRIYNVSYIVPVDFSGTPKISFTFECTC